MPAPVPRPHRPAAAGLALFALVITGAAAIALDVLAPGTGPLTQPLSFFAHTSYAWLWRLAVASAAGGICALAFALQRRGVVAPLPRALVVAALGLALGGCCAADPWFPWERPPTVAGMFHLGAVLGVVVAFALAMARRAASLPGRTGIASYRIAELAYLLSLAGALIYSAAMVITGRRVALFGLWERLVIGSALLWCALLAIGALGPPDGGRLEDTHPFSGR